MGKKTVVKWVLDENDKNQIKQYSEQISKLFKLRGYNPNRGKFYDYFDGVEDFLFIPCIKEGYKACEVEEYYDFTDDAIEAFNADYNPDVKISMEDIENQAKETGDTADEIVYDHLSANNRECDVSDWILENCDPITVQKFLDWVYKY